MPDSPALRELRARLDAGLSRRPRLALDRSDLVSAAVLVPITARDGRPHLVFTKKSDGVPHHKGQFSFPGGVVEQRDASRVEAALREAWEEIRLPAEAVEVLGLLDDTETRATSFIITPVVGIVTEAVELRARRPRDRARDRGPARDRWRIPRSSAQRRGRAASEAHEVYFYQVSPDDVVWGATARIVKQFLDMLAEEERRG